MTGVFDGVAVLDLTDGMAGGMTAMLLADHGAVVTRIEPPGGGRFDELSGSVVWNRGKRRAVLDVDDPDDRQVVVDAARTADVLIESFAPGTTQRLGIDYETLRTANPRLIYCSITGYGSSGRDADRPAIDALVAARTGHNVEGRGVVGGTIARISGGDGVLPGLEKPADCWVGPERDGPLFSGVPWISLATFYNASLGISAALRAREITGRGQRVETSLLQGALTTTVAAWQRVEHPDARGYQSWIIDPRAPKGFFRGADGSWQHHWVPLPAFVLGASAGDRLDPAGGVAPKDAPLRIGVDAEEMVILLHYYPLMAEAVKKFPTGEWVDVAARVGVPVQHVRSPEAGLLDDAFVADGCVVELDDPEHGPIRQVGRVYSLSRCPTDRPSPRRPRGADTAALRDEVASTSAGASVASSTGAPRSLAHPLAGVRVLDLGLAVAGPWGTQLLAELGADVIKVNSARDKYWMTNHIAMTCNRSKRSIVLDLKTDDGTRVLRQLVADADVVQHNMRHEAAVRLGVDYESLAAINPRLIYCHTRGFDRGARDGLPGNDQTGAALAGTTWCDGGMDFDDGRPHWSLSSMGDTGNGFLSAIGIVQALYHRDRTGEGQLVDTSIAYAQLLNASSAWASADGSAHGARHRLRGDATGMSATYRLYQTADDRWIALAVLTSDQFSALGETIGRRADFPAERFSPAGNPGPHDDELTKILTDAFETEPADTWFERLDTAGVPVEICNPDWVLALFDDDEMRRKGWVTSFRHPTLGQMDMFGSLIDFSDTPGKVWGAPLVPGQHSREILRGLGYGDADIDGLVETGVVEVFDPTAPDGRRA